MTTQMRTHAATQIAVFRAHRDIDVEMMRSYVEIGDGCYWTVEALAWAPDERHWASAGADDTLRIWDFGAGRQLHVYGWDRSRGHILDMVWSPDGRNIALLAGRALATRVIVLDAFTGAEVYVSPGLEGMEIVWPEIRATDAAVPASAGAASRDHSRTWSPGGRYYLLGSGESPPPPPDEAGPAASTWRSDGSRNGRRITAHRVQVIQAGTGRVALTMPHGMSWLAWSPEGNCVAGAHGRVVTVWDVDAPETPAWVYHGHAGWFTHITCLSWAPSGNYIASGDSAGVVHLWRMPSSGRHVASS